jgi:hypothetical protein
MALLSSCTYFWIAFCFHRLRSQGNSSALRCHYPLCVFGAVRCEGPLRVRTPSKMNARNMSSGRYWVCLLKNEGIFPAYCFSIIICNFARCNNFFVDEIDVGICDGLTYEEIETTFKQEFELRSKDKLRYRYPRGESYEDVVRRYSLSLSFFSFSLSLPRFRSNIILSFCVCVCVCLAEWSQSSWSWSGPAGLSSSSAIALSSAACMRTLPVCYVAI